MADQQPVRKPDRRHRPERSRRDSKSKNRNSGQGAASALATWREIERSRIASQPDSTDHPLV